VTIPANAEATIISVKQYDIQLPAKPALKGKSVRVVRLESPAVAGAKFVVRNIIR